MDYTQFNTKYFSKSEFNFVSTTGGKYNASDILQFYADYDCLLTTFRTVAECQHKSNNDYCGLFLDFDFKTDIKYEISNYEILQKIHMILDLIASNTNTDINVFKDYCFYFSVKPEIIFLEKDNKWKNGVHMYFPSIGLRKSDKKRLLEILSNFLQNEWKSALDNNCINVPVLLKDSYKNLNSGYKPYLYSACKFNGSDMDIVDDIIIKSINLSLTYAFQ